MKKWDCEASSMCIFEDGQPMTPEEVVGTLRQMQDELQKAKDQQRTIEVLAREVFWWRWVAGTSNAINKFGGIVCNRLAKGVCSSRGFDLAFSAVNLTPDARRAVDAVYEQDKEYR